MIKLVIPEKETDRIKETDPEREIDQDPMIDLKNVTRETRTLQ